MAICKSFSGISEDGRIKTNNALLPKASPWQDCALSFYQAARLITIKRNRFAQKRDLAVFYTWISLESLSLSFPLFYYSFLKGQNELILCLHSRIPHQQDLSGHRMIPFMILGTQAMQKWINGSCKIKKVANDPSNPSPPIKYAEWLFLSHS